MSLDWLFFCLSLLRLAAVSVKSQRGLDLFALCRGLSDSAVVDFLPSFGFRLIPVPGWLFSSVVATSLEWFRSVSAFQLGIVEWLPVELGL